MAKKPLEVLVQWFDAYEQATVTSRQDSERDRDYYDGHQWTASEEAELNKRSQPKLTFNRIKPKVDFLVGTEIETRTDPKAYPRTPAHEEVAQVATDAIRYVVDNNDWDSERTQAFEDFIVEGTTAIDVRIVPKVRDLGMDGSQAYISPYPDVADEPEIQLQYVPWDRLFWDPRSRFADFRDAKYFGTVVWMDEEDVLDLWTGKKDVIENSTGASPTNSAYDDTFEDRPRIAVWQETVAERKRVKVCQMWYWASGEWYVSTFTRGGFLEEPIVSPYKDEAGRSIPSLILQSAHVDRENNRYGIVRSLISPQDEINKRRSKSLHYLMMRQVVLEKGAVADTRVTREELAKPDGMIEVRPEARFETLPNTDLTSWHFNLLQEAKGEIDAIGANSALTGKESRDMSGRAIQARQRGGMIEVRKLFDRLRNLQLRTYRSVWFNIKQFWKAPRYVRVRDEENALKFLGLNVPQTNTDVLQERGVAIPPPEQVPPEIAAELQAPAPLKNEVAEIDVDLIIEEAPDVIAIQQEQFEALANMASSGVPIPPDVLIEASTIRNKKGLLERMRSGGATPQEQQAAQQEQQKQQAIQDQAIQLDLAQKQIDIEKTQADIKKTLASAQESLAGAQAVTSDAHVKVFEATKPEPQSPQQ